MAAEWHLLIAEHWLQFLLATVIVMSDENPVMGPGCRSMMKMFAVSAIS